MVTVAVLLLDLIQESFTTLCLTHCPISLHIPPLHSLCFPLKDVTNFTYQKLKSCLHEFLIQNTVCPFFNPCTILIIKELKQVFIGHIWKEQSRLLCKQGDSQMCLSNLKHGYLQLLALEPLLKFTFFPWHNHQHTQTLPSLGFIKTTQNNLSTFLWSWFSMESLREGGEERLISLPWQQTCNCVNKLSTYNSPTVYKSCVRIQVPVQHSFEDSPTMGLAYQALGQLAAVLVNTQAKFFSYQVKSKESFQVLVRCVPTSMEKTRVWNNDLSLWQLPTKHIWFRLHNWK